MTDPTSELVTKESKIKGVEDKKNSFLIVEFSHLTERALTFFKGTLNSMIPKMTDNINFSKYFLMKPSFFDTFVKLNDKRTKIANIRSFNHHMETISISRQTALTIMDTESPKIRRYECKAFSIEPRHERQNKYQKIFGLNSLPFLEKAQ